MFRDTFAVELLKRGVPIETVSMLLGHASIKVTEKHYKPWVKTLQDKLEADAMKGWPQSAPVPQPAARRIAARKQNPRNKACDVASWRRSRWTVKAVGVAPTT